MTGKRKLWDDGKRFSNVFKEKIAEIEATTIAEIGRLEKDLLRLRRGKVVLTSVLLVVWGLLCWPVSASLGAAWNFATLCGMGFVYCITSSILEETWQRDGESKRYKEDVLERLRFGGLAHSDNRNGASRSPELLGAMYEVRVGLLFESRGYQVEYRGLMRGRLDGGIDLVCSLNRERLYVQCKYWKWQRLVDHSVILALHTCVNAEKVVAVNFGYSLRGVIVTSTRLSSRARSLAAELGVQYIEYQMLRGSTTEKMSEVEGK